MITHKVKFLPHGKEIAFADSRSVLDAAMEAGVHVNASCGGEGFCGKCRIIIEKGHIEEGISASLSKENIQAGYRLACLSRIKSDLTVRVPGESEIDASLLNRSPPGDRPNPADEPGRPEKQGSIYTPC